MQQIIITFDSAYATAENLANLLEITGCGVASEYLKVTDFHEKFFCAGTLGVFAIEKVNNQLIGMVRVFTDDILTTYVSDVCVHPSYQKKGVGTNLIKAVSERFHHTAIFTEAFRDSASMFTRNAIGPKEKLIACSRRPHLPLAMTH